MVVTSTAHAVGVEVTGRSGERPAPGAVDLPPERFSELGAYDGSVMAERTNGDRAARGATYSQ